MTTVVPMDDELARLGRCWACKQHFEGEEFYCQVTPIATAVEVWVTCIGCAAQLACAPAQMPPGEERPG